MTTSLEIPTEGGRSFSERVPLSDGITYTLKFNWNKRAACWTLDIYDSTGQGRVICGIPLVTGADLMEQFLYLSFGRNTFWTAMTTGPGLSPDEVPTFFNLGTDGRLFLTNLV